MIWWYRELPYKLLFRDILRLICYIDFKSGSINFHKVWKQPAKYQCLHIAHDKKQKINDNE